MFDIGFSELVVIGLIALIVLGPKRLPEVARTAGKWAAQLRRFVSEVKQDFDREINHEELAELRKFKQELDGTRNMMENTSGELLQGFTEIAPASTTPTIHSNESLKQAPPASTKTPAPSSSPKHARTKRDKKARSGRKHGGTRRTRR